MSSATRCTVRAVGYILARLSSQDHPRIIRVWQTRQLREGRHVGYCHRTGCCPGRGPPAGPSLRSPNRPEAARLRTASSAARGQTPTERAGRRRAPDSRRARHRTCTGARGRGARRTGRRVYGRIQPRLPVPAPRRRREAAESGTPRIAPGPAARTELRPAPVPGMLISRPSGRARAVPEKD